LGFTSSFVPISLVEEERKFFMDISNMDERQNVIRITSMILGFCPDLSQRVNQDRNLPITQRTSPEEEERIQQAT
jgi:hypothetical protein